MSSLYAQYLLEREGKLTYELDYGFVTYELSPPHAYLSDMFIAKRARGSGLRDILEQYVIDEAKRNDCSIMLTSICLSANNWFNSKRVVRENNYRFLRLDKPTKMVYFIKEI